VIKESYDPENKINKKLRKVFIIERFNKMQRDKIIGKYIINQQKLWERQEKWLSRMQEQGRYE
jgi:hypothetical protein